MPVRIPVYRPLGPRDRLIGGGPRLVSIISDATDVEHVLNNTNDYSTASGMLNNINAQMVQPGVDTAQVGATQFITHAPLLRRLQENSNPLP